jgi:SAM-dependent methyltransferase
VEYNDVIAEYYDVFYSKKDYEKEITFLNKAYGSLSGKKILDIGCGTGTHALLMAQQDPKFIYGFDLSEFMISKAILKNYDNNVLKFERNDISNVPYTDFDLSISMFNVVNHIQRVDQVMHFFHEIRKRMKKGGYFIFDIWNGVAAIQDWPKKETRIYKVEDKIIETHWTPKIDLMSLEVTMHTEGTIVYPDKQPDTFNYSLSHTVWTSKSISDLLFLSGFRVLKINKSFTEIKAKHDDYKIVFICEAF